MRYLMITLSLLILMGCAHSQLQADSFTIESLGDGIYVHHGVHLDIDDGYHGDICNASFVIGSKGVAVIDTGGSIKVGNQLRDAIRALRGRRGHGAHRCVARSGSNR